jgi:hypothetical protein
MQVAFSAGASSAWLQARPVGLRRSPRILSFKEDGAPAPKVKVSFKFPHQASRSRKGGRLLHLNAISSFPAYRGSCASILCSAAQEAALAG